MSKRESKSKLGGAGTQIGPLISPAAKERVCSLIQSAIDEGISCSSSNFLHHDYYSNQFYLNLEIFAIPLLIVRILAPCQVRGT